MSKQHIRKADHNNEQIAPSNALPCEKVSTFLVVSCSKVSNFYCLMNSSRSRRSQGSSKGRNRECFSCCWSYFTAKNLVSIPLEFY